MRPLFLIMGAWLFLSSAPSFALPLPELALTPAWRHLLHYRDRLFLGPKSQEVGSTFFFSPSGRFDPEAELRATLAAFQDNQHHDLRKAALCAFPARKKFLETSLALKLDSPECADYAEWKRGLGAKGATLVYSSAFPNNPAAMFGHVLLRLDRAEKQSSREGLMSYSAAYSANIPPATGNVSYAINGILGGFLGQFSIAPYYTQVNDYTNAEMRDLWEYPLRLTAAQVDRLVDHLWELFLSGYFDYYFFTQNCATQQLALLQAAVPELPLLDGMPWYTLPVEAIHHLKKLGLLDTPTQRPSAKKKFLAARATLSPAERSDLRALIEDPNKIETTQNSALLDTAAAFWNYRKFTRENWVQSQEQSTLHRILLQRAKLGPVPARPLEFSQNSQPDLGHDASAAVPVFAYADQEYRVGLRYKLGMHDLLDGELGFEPFSQIDYLNVYAYYVPKTNKLRLGELRVFESTSLYPIEAYDHKFSWKLSVRSEQPLKTFCDTCQREVLEGGGGLSTFGFSAKDLWYALVSARFAYSSATSPKRWDLGPGLQTGLLYRFSPVHRANLEAKAEWDFNRSYDQSIFCTYGYTQAYTLSQRWELRGKLAYLARPTQPDRRAELQSAFFF